MQIDDWFTATSPDVDPYAMYDELRHGSRVVWSDALGGWLIHRYIDVVSVLHDPRFSQFSETTVAQRPALADAFEVFDRLPIAQRQKRAARLGIDGEAATVADPTFSNPNDLGGLIAELSGKQVDAHRTRGHFDVVSQFAVPVAVEIVTRLLSLSPHAAARIGAAVFDLFKSSDHSLRSVDATAPSGGGISPSTRGSRRATERKAAQPFGAGPAGDRLSVIALGYHTAFTIQAVVATGIHLLLSHREQLERLQKDKTLLARGIAEIIRFESPIQIVRRRVDCDLDFRGAKLRSGETLWLIMGAANRDPARFTDPDRFDIGRLEAPNLSFGAGQYLCRGRSAASAAAEGCIWSLVHILPALAETERRPAWLPAPHLRCLSSLPVLFSRIRARGNGGP